MHRLPRLHLVTPPGVDEAVVHVTKRAVRAGAPLIQLRTKGTEDRVRLRHLRAVQDAAANAAAGGSGVLCLVNDRVDLAMAVGAAGVHLGAEDLPVEVARQLLGPAAVIGATARDPESARRAVAAGATYLGVGPAYTTRTKAGLPEPIGVHGVAAVAQAVTVPVIAIAGITAARIPELLDAGAWGVAVVGAVYDAPDPVKATVELLEALS